MSERRLAAVSPTRVVLLIGAAALVQTLVRGDDGRAAAWEPLRLAAHAQPAALPPLSLDWLTDGSGRYPLRQSDGRLAAIGWLNLIGDAALAAAFIALPIALTIYIRRRPDAPLADKMWLVSSFMAACGVSHLLAAAALWWPADGVAGVVKLTAAALAAAVFLLFARNVPLPFGYRSHAQLTKEIEQRTSELEQSQALGSLLFEVSPSGMLMADRQGTIVLVNKQVELIFGYPREELIGKPVEILAPTEQQEGHVAMRDVYFEHPEPRPMGGSTRVYGQRKNGESFPIEVGLTPVWTNNGVCALSAIVDVSRQAEDAEKLRTYAEELERSNQELEQFAYVASHDLQEPLRKVASCCQTLMEDYGDKLDEPAREWIGFAVDGAKRMRALVSDLLSYSRVSTYGRAVAPTDSQSACQQAVSNLSMAIDDAGAEVIVRPLPRVMADHTQLIHLFQNLIGNGLKYRGADPPLIEVGAESVDDDWQFYVKDNGIGIDPQFHERIFVIFQRLHHREQYSGTGIGLAICKKIVERLGGRIWVESQPGCGATFYFTFRAIGSSSSARGQHAKRLRATH